MIDSWNAAVLNENIDNQAANWKALSVLGAKNLNATPYYHSSGRTSHGVTFTVNDDGSVSTSGTATGGDALFQCHTRLDTDNNKLVLPNGRYVLSGCASGGSSAKYNIQVIGTKSGAAFVYGYDYGSGVSFALNGDEYYTDKAVVGVYITIKNGVDASDLVFRPMIRFQADSDKTWEPYAMTNQELTKAIKANAPINYSTSETDTGITWIDGSEIYQKTISLTTAIELSPSTSSWTSTSISTSDISKIIDVKAMHNDGTIYCDVSGDPTGTGQTLKLRSASSATIYYLTLQYTKPASALTKSEPETETESEPVETKKKSKNKEE